MSQSIKVLGIKNQENAIYAFRMIIVLGIKNQENAITMSTLIR